MKRFYNALTRRVYYLIGRATPLSINHLYIYVCVYIYFFYIYIIYIQAVSQVSWLYFKSEILF